MAQATPVPQPPSQARRVVFVGCHITCGLSSSVGFKKMNLSCECFVKVALNIGETYQKFLQEDIIKAGSRKASTILSENKENDRPEKTARGLAPPKGSGRGGPPPPSLSLLSDNGSAASEGSGFMGQIEALLDRKFAPFEKKNILTRSILT